MRRTRTSSRAAAALLFAAIGITACGSSYTPSAAARTSFVDARAAALCEVKTHVYADKQALEAAYTASQHAAISDRDAQVLKRAVDNDATLRADITARVTSLCG
jgi:hypothetical protein